MLDFELTRQQAQARELAHALARDVVRPLALDADRTGRVPEEFLVRMAALRGGLSGEPVPKEVGGEGVGVGATRDGRGRSQTNRLSIVLGEEMAWGDVPVMMNLPGPGLGGPPVRFAGTEAQQRRFFGVFTQPGLHWGAYALTEPGAGSDVAGIATTCRREGSDWILDGRKCFITNGARADWVVVFATVDRALGRAGHRMFVVERGTPGLSVGKIEDKMGLRASETAELVLEGCRVPGDNLLGGEAHYAGKEGFLGAMKTFDASRPMVGIFAVGIARAAWEVAADFLRAELRGAAPSPRTRALAETLAAGKARLDAARLLCWKAAWMADEGVPNAREASEAKAYAARVAMAVCRDAMLAMGAAGLEESRFVEKWYRDLKVFDIFEGTGQIQRIVIAKRLLREPPVW